MDTAKCECPGALQRFANLGSMVLRCSAVETSSKMTGWVSAETDLSVGGLVIIPKKRQAVAPWSCLDTCTAGWTNSELAALFRNCGRPQAVGPRDLS